MPKPSSCVCVCVCVYKSEHVGMATVMSLVTRQFSGWLEGVGSRGGWVFSPKNPKFEKKEGIGCLSWDASSP